MPSCRRSGGRKLTLVENRVRVVNSKTDLGSRSIAIPPKLAERLWQHRRTTWYRADSDRVSTPSAASRIL